MTREEAIKGLKVLRKDFSGYKPNEEMFDMAIKALEQEPCEVSEYDSDHIWYKGGQYISLRRFLEVKAEADQKPCGDAISRQAVLEIFGYVMDYWKEHAIDVEPHEIEDALIEQYEFTAKQLSELPPVNPQEPKTGHWIEKDGYSDCSECGSHIVIEWDYCPNCGAKMIESRESEEA